MAKKFNFKDNDLKLEIEGETFKLDTSNPELISRVVDFGNEATKRAKELENEDSYVEALEQLIAFCTDSIDTILGEKASKRIWKDRSVSLFDAMDVINYIIASVKEDREDKFNKYTPNRAQRRS